MDNYQIFISYRRDGGEMLGQLLYDRLTQKGYKVFFDVESLRSGKFNEELYHVLEECTDIIVVLPPNALDRCSNPEDWVRKEISFGISKNKKIIPILMRGFFFPEDLPEDIKEIKNYNGISAREVSSFPWVINQLTEKFLDSKPTNSKKANKNVNGNKTIVYNSISTFLKNVFFASILLLPFVSQLFDFKYDWLPDPVGHLFSAYTNVNLNFYLIMLGALFLICRLSNIYLIKSNFEYNKKVYKDKNLNETFFNYCFEDFIIKILAIDNLSAIVNNKNNVAEQPHDFASYKQFKGMEFGSLNGSHIDYFYIDFTKLPNTCDLSVLYLNKNTSKGSAIKFLSKQGFALIDESEGILSFFKGLTFINIAYTTTGLKMLAFEMTKADVASKICEKTLEVRETSFVSVLQQLLKKIKIGIKKCKVIIKKHFYKLNKKTQDLILISGIALYVLLCIFIAIFFIKSTT